ncbi:hypothetical protein K040078D81_19120 [Blautia hominis]|uniref:Uncharacterized protein n=1 Tax=Blautia hominis TaxID=2025493 RepID=A0ABQ0B8L0_9FIRM
MFIINIYIYVLASNEGPSYNVDNKKWQVNEDAGNIHGLSKTEKVPGKRDKEVRNVWKRK